MQMNSRITLVVASVLAIAIFAAEAVVVVRERDDGRWFDESDRAVTSMVDKLEFFDTPAAFSRGRMENASLAKADDAGPARFVLDFPDPKGFPREGTWTSPKIETDFPFSELLPS